ELAVINSIQQGLAAELNFQAIVDLVGDKLRAVLRTEDIGIRLYDEKTNLTHYLYEYEHGKRLTVAPMAPRPGGSWFQVLETRQPIVRNTREESAAGGHLPGTDISLSSALVPIIVSDRVIGVLIVESFEREYAFGDSELRLLQTIAASMGGALDNARLFDETQRLFKAEQARVAELAVINSIQQGIASELQFQAIIDMVGDKLREVLGLRDMCIDWYEPQANLLHHVYAYEHGVRMQLPATPPRPAGPWSRMVKNRQPEIANTREELRASGVLTVPGTDEAFSSVT